MLISTYSSQDTTGKLRIPGHLSEILRHLEQRGCLRLADQLSGAWAWNGAVRADCLHVFSEVEIEESGKDAAGYR